MSYPRVNRVNEEYKKAISSLLRTELKDPRISKMTSVVSVDVTRDLSYAYVYVSVLGTKSEKEETIKGLEKSAGYVRRAMAKKISLRHTPEVIFKLDESIEYGVNMSQKIDQLNHEKFKNENADGFDKEDFDE
ncbi:30S ribosome-binding factor RbfA [Tindallia californiensis]|uniref:Ribosome-binding factor A n=1 Tax=Tindallia californiensis TaxID=159292 RepID=A0A1H3NPH1_9FIRM|nr:30S ribosome-binding factor RbfA [Tindallia californiensis]SDY90580.1 ribosome-binding factor A [Tindallia californiensis]